MSNFQDEEILGKAYDSKLMKRLLSYAKPFWKGIAFCIFLLLLITVVDLARPYIIKIAIDEHITNYSTPYIVIEHQNDNSDAINFRGKTIVRSDQYGDSLSENLPRLQLINWRNNYYIIEGQVDSNKDYRLSDNILTQGNDSYQASLVTKEELKVLRSQDISNITRLGIIYLILITVGFVLNYIQVFVLQYTGQKIIFDIRQRIFSHLQKMSLSFFDKNPVGRLVTRVTNDTETLNEMYTSVLVNLFKDFFMLIGIILIMLKLNVTLSLITFAVLPLIILSSVLFRVHARKAYREVRTKLAKINASLNENISGIKIVQIFKRETKKFDEFDDINNQYYKSSIKELKVFAIFRPSMDLIYALALSLMIWYGGGRVVSGTLQFGVLFAFVNYIGQFFQPINDLTEKYNILQSAMASSERIFMLLDEKEGVPNIEDPISAPRLKGEIEFKNVWFAYKDEEWVLRDVSFKISPGQSAAFVGPTGAGKSSIINLLSRFYDIQRGEILIDGVNIKNMDKDELRRNIGVVLQDVFLFTGDIKTNIRLNNQDISDDRIQEVCKYVNADTFISKLPMGYEEEVKERGATLSSGQRQLLAFARALAFNPSVLVLDEATSNIDTETELLIQDALSKIIKDRTTIIVAHRLSTIQHCDKIIVLHKGKIREVGNHQQLLDLEGIYYHLYLLQYKNANSSIEA